MWLFCGLVCAASALSLSFFLCACVCVASFFRHVRMTHSLSSHYFLHCRHAIHILHLFSLTLFMCIRFVRDCRSKHLTHISWRKWLRMAFSISLNAHKSIVMAWLFAHSLFCLLLPFLPQWWWERLSLIYLRHFLYSIFSWPFSDSFLHTHSFLSFCFLYSATIISPHLSCCVLIHFK